MPFAVFSDQIYKIWRVTLLSIQAEPLKIVSRRTMEKLLIYRNIAIPAYGIKEIEFSAQEVKDFRQSNLRERWQNQPHKDGEPNDH